MQISISGRIIGKKKPVFIIAELSANHNQDFDLAVKTIEAAKKAGADAIKLQTYTPDTITINSNNKYFQIKKGTVWDGQTLYELYKQAYTPWEWQPKLKKIAEKLGLICFSSPFDKTAVEFLKKMRVPAYKIASFEITDIPLIRYIAKQGKPVIISTGIATLSDIKLAIRTCRLENNNQIILLKCTSSYPAPYEDSNLQTIPDMKKRFKVNVGLSDHTLGISVPIAAVALGATVIEKHLILSRKLIGPDSSFSLEPDEFADMVKAVRQTEKAMGKVTYKLTSKMKKSREFSRSLFTVVNIKKGDKITEKNIRSIRPGFGMHPKNWEKVIGMRAVKNISANSPLKWSQLK